MGFIGHSTTFFSDPRQTRQFSSIAAKAAVPDVLQIRPTPNCRGTEPDHAMPVWHRFVQIFSRLAGTMDKTLNRN
jgi:hypothetical protein